MNQSYNIKKIKIRKFLFFALLILVGFTASANEFGVNGEPNPVSEQDYQSLDNPATSAVHQVPPSSLPVTDEQALVSSTHNVNTGQESLNSVLPNYQTSQNNVPTSVPVVASNNNNVVSHVEVVNHPVADPTIVADNNQLSNDQNHFVEENDSTSGDAEIPVTPPVDQSSIGDSDASRQAFAATVRNLMPLSPDQIKALRYIFDQSQRAVSTEPGSFPPKPTSSAVIVNLSPGSTPPVIRLRAGYITSLVFLDSTGQPWPIGAYDLGNPKSFNIQWDQKSNTLMVQALDSYQTGNLAVMLKDENTPVMLTLLPGQQEVDYRVDLRVPGLGPNASEVVDDMPGTENPRLLDFLNGTPPQGSQLLHVTGNECQAWLLGNRLYLRTRLTLLSPGWLATMSSPDGTHVYQLVKTPVVLVSARGKIIQLRIEGL